MEKSNLVKIVVFVPESHTDIVKNAMSKVGAGKMGKYSHCFFSSKGVGEFLPGDGAKPAIGQIGKLELVDEYKIETVCERQYLDNVIKAIKDVHPYEEVALDIWPLE